jgi:hypothetical protein
MFDFEGKQNRNREDRDQRSAVRCQDDLSTRSAFASSLQQSLVFVVRADPKPVERAFVHSSESAPAARDTDRPVRALAFKAQRGMPRVFFPEVISLTSLCPNFRRQRMVGAPEYAVRGRRWMDCIAAWEAASDRAGRESTYSSPRTSSSGFVRPALMSSIASAQR